MYAFILVLDFKSSSFVIMNLYSLVDSSSAVTIIVIVFSPVLRFKFPFIEYFAFSSFKITFISTDEFLVV